MSSLFLVFHLASLFMPHHIALLTSFVLLSSLKGHMLCIFIAFFFFFFTCQLLWSLHISDLFASFLSHGKYGFSWTRPLTTVKLSSLHLPLHPYARHPCLFVFIHSLLTQSLLPPPNTTHSYPPPWLHSCSFIPRGEEQTPIITQVSVKWIIGRLIELLDGKHPSWVVQLSVLSLLPHRWLAWTYSLPLLRKTGCGLQPLCAVAETMTSGREM